MATQILIGTFGLLVPSIIAASYWLLKIYIPKKIEAQVTHQYNLKLEEFKSQLAITANERSLRFSHVYAKTAEVMQAFFTKINDAQVQAASLLRAMDGAEAEYAHWHPIVNSKMLEASAYAMNNNVYFPPECDRLAVLLINLLDEIKDGCKKIQTNRQASNPRVQDEMIALRLGLKKKAAGVETGLNQLKEEMRVVLGIVERKSTKAG